MEAYAGTPTRLSIAGIDAQGRAGEASEPVQDILTPAFVALSEGRSADAERWLTAAFEETRGRTPSEPDQLASLARLRAWAVASGGDFERALGIVESAGSLLDPHTAAVTRMGIYREAIRAAATAGDGAAAVAWLDLVAQAAPGALTSLEERARGLASAGDTDAAARLLVALGGVRDPSPAAIGRAIAEIRMAGGRYEEALADMIAAYRAAADPAERDDLDRSLAILAEAALDRVSGDGAGPTAPGRVLAPLREFAATLAGSAREAWELRVAALEARPRIRAALELAPTDFSTARDMLEAALAEAGAIFVDDEIRARAALGELALAANEEGEAREQFLRVLELRPDWVPDPEEFSPTVRAFVDSLRHGGSSSP
jgi:tetratricopeptide (TPR) repeat protein